MMVMSIVSHGPAELSFILAVGSKHSAALAGCNVILSCPLQSMASAHEVALSSYRETLEYEVPRGSQVSDTREGEIAARKGHSYTILPIQANTALSTVISTTGKLSPNTLGQRPRTGLNSKATVWRIHHSLQCWDIILLLLVLTALLLGLTALVLGAVIVGTHCESCREEKDSSNLQPLEEDTVLGAAALREEVENLMNEVSDLLENATIGLDVSAIYDGCFTETRQCIITPSLTNVNITGTPAMCSTRVLSTARTVSLYACM